MERPDGTQQQPVLNLKMPAVDISMLRLAEREQIERGNPAAMTNLFNHVLQPTGITVQCGRKADRIGVVVEAATVPDRSQVGYWMRQQFKQLPLQGVCKVEVYGRQLGHTRPAWRETIELCQVQVLRFHINSTATALLPLEGVREVLNISFSEILPVPQMPCSVLGVCYYQGMILWLVDLGLQLGLHGTQARRSLELCFAQRGRNSRQAVAAPTLALSVVVIEANQTMMGLVVSKVLDVESHPLHNFHPVTTRLFAPSLLPFVQRYLVHSQYPLLNVAALINDRNLQVHRL